MDFIKRVAHPTVCDRQDVFTFLLHLIRIPKAVKNNQINREILNQQTRIAVQMIQTVNEKHTVQFGGLLRRRLSYSGLMSEPFISYTD